MERGRWKEGVSMERSRIERKTRMDERIRMRTERRWTNEDGKKK